MSKLDCGKDDSHQEWMLTTDAPCCFIHMAAYKEKGFNSFFLGGICESGKYWDTWRGRLSVAWSALRGKLVCHDIEFYTAESANRFITEFKEASDWTFGSQNERSKEKPEKPMPPPLKYHDDFYKGPMCPSCNSDFPRKFIFYGARYCINPNCKGEFNE